jgi:hypothetical protein
MDYETASDFEINKAVADIFLPCDYLFDEDKSTVDLVGDCDVLLAHGMHDTSFKKYGEFDPCNNPSDAWPIIVENRIQIHCWKNDLWYCAWGDDGFIVEYETEPMESPLRAAMIAFLMMSNITKESVQ